MASEELQPQQPAAEQTAQDGQPEQTSTEQSLLSGMSPSSGARTKFVSPRPRVSNADDPFRLMYCQWVDCDEEAFRGPEALYEHLCEKHVGRKSTNNLNLTCQWGACGTTTVKRDHITSHIRVHVPLKPHSCEFCGKAFKRPQDLKKHVKTHADDSVLMRSPDNNGHDQKQQGNYTTDPKAYFPGHDLANSAYPPPPNGQLGGPNSNFYPTPQQYSGYGQVNYPGSSVADQQSMDTRRRAIEALNDFLGDVKRRALDPGSYYDVGQRLNTQSLPLPVSIGAGYSIGANGYGGNNHHSGQSYGSASHGLFDTFGGGSSGAHNSLLGHPVGDAGVHGALAQNYALPMSNARTKADLLDIDRFLEQLSATVYESSGQAAAAGVQQPGIHTQVPGHYPGYNSFQRSSHSPPHEQGMATGTDGGARPLASVAQIASMTAMANGNTDTPALTPASVSSYTSSGHSPISSHSRSSGDGASLYPQLPSVTSMSEIGPSYSSAPPSGLTSASYDYDSRRYSSGRLQRAAPPARAEAADDDAMDVDTDGQRTPRKNSTVKAERAQSSSNVDPALRSANSPESDGSPRDTPEEKAQEAWLENIRVIEQLRAWIRDRLEHSQFERDQDSTPEPNKDDDQEVERRLQQRLNEESANDQPIAYPTLKSEA